MRNLILLPGMRLIAYAMFLGITFSSGSLHGGTECKHSYYIWQRDWRNKNIMEAATKEPDASFYVLFREFRTSKTEIIHTDKALFALPNRIIPVFRIHTKFFVEWINHPHKTTNKITIEFQKITAIAKKYGKKIKELQIDLDCPVSKLEHYGKFLKGLKTRLPTEVILSFTALPCHLKSDKFINVAKSADYYVVQVHGLEMPKNIKDDVSLLNLKTAEAALRSAEHTPVPFMLALPAYAYQLNFNRETGKFLFLNAEYRPPKDDSTISKIISPSFGDLLRLLSEVKKNPGNCIGIIWFRLPVIGDRFNIDMRTLKEIQFGKTPRTGLIPHWEPQKNGAKILYITNRGILDIGIVKISIKWRVIDGTYDLFNGFHATGGVGSHLPETISADAIPSPGRKIPVGWFRNRSDSVPEVKAEYIKRGNQ